jgi:hypothetical protein
LGTLTSLTKLSLCEPADRGLGQQQEEEEQEQQQQQLQPGAQQCKREVFVNAAWLG